jgi:hypothetical protein
MSLLLGMNVDHVATLRQARYALLPDSPNAEPCPLEACQDAIAGGADSITIHVRGDRRHMQVSDAFLIKESISVPLNFEMGVTAEMIAIALRLQPAFVCLVPEKREEVTTEGGLDVIAGRREIGDARALYEARPVYSLDRIVKERYPRFADALGDGGSEADHNAVVAGAASGGSTGGVATRASAARVRIMGRRPAGLLLAQRRNPYTPDAQGCCRRTPAGLRR